jgi:hypothetical protein
MLGANLLESLFVLSFNHQNPQLGLIALTDTHRLSHFDGTNFPYYSARMACYLEIVYLGVWRVTHDGMKPLKNPEKPTTSEKKNSFEC